MTLGESSVNREGRLPDIRQALAWRTWEDGLEEAERRQRPILCLAEAPWTNSAQRLGLVLGRDEPLREIISSSFVPVLLDPWARPDLAARLRWASVVLTGTAGPPLMALLSHEGLPFLSYPSLWPEGHGPYPSLMALLRSSAEGYTQRRDSLLEEARCLQASFWAADTEADAPCSIPCDNLWQALEDEFDERFGGLNGLPKRPDVALLWWRLEACEAGEAQGRDWLVKTLDGMRRGGFFDQLGGSFHRCARDERWVVPHFEKLAFQNAGLAAVYARAAAHCRRPDFTEVARQAATFALSCLDYGVDAVASNTPYYTWTSQEVGQALSPALIQVLGPHFHLTPHPSPHVLYRALEPEAIEAEGVEPALIRERLEVGKAELSRVRARRPPPDPVTLGALSGQAHSLRWLFEAAGQGLELPREALVRQLGELEQRDSFQGRRAQARLEDRAAVCLAYLAAHRLTGSREHLGAARQAADTMIKSHLDPRTGTLRDSPARDEPATAAAQEDEAQPWKSQPETQDVVDHDLPSAVGATLSALVTLARLEQDGSYLWAARAIADRYGVAARRATVRASTFWHARCELETVNDHPHG